MDLATPTIHKSGNSLHVTHGDDSNLYVEFEMRAIHQEAESEAAGRPIYKDVPHIKIMFPGDKNKLIYRPIKTISDQTGRSDPERFPRHWAAFQAQESHVNEGTPIEEWPPLTKSQAKELKSINIHTVEMLASLPDTALDGLGLGGRSLRDKSIEWLNAASQKNKQLKVLMDEVQDWKSKYESLQEQINELKALKESPESDSFTEVKPKPRGRPKAA